MRIRTLAICGLVAAGVLAGCSPNAGKVDPFESSNRCIYKFNDCVDRAVLQPLSDCYVKATPECVRTGTGNAFGNLAGLNVILNDYLQGNCRQGASDAARMAINTTVGVAGIFDVASGCGMPAHRNDFGLTLGKWGADSGPYLVLPLLGPSSCRDIWGVPVSAATNPLAWADLPVGVTAGLGALDAIDTRARLDPAVKLREQAALDPYVFTRDAYFQHRAALLAKETGKPVDQEGLYDEENGGPSTRPATQPATRPATQPAK